MNEHDFELLVESIRQAGEIKRGECKPSRLFEFSPLDVKAIRARLDQSQSEFARMIGVSVGTLRNWKQGRRKPEGPTACVAPGGAAQSRGRQTGAGRRRRLLR